MCHDEGARDAAPEGEALDAAQDHVRRVAEVDLAEESAKGVELQPRAVKGALLHEGELSAGVEHRFTFEPGFLPSGVYLIRASGEHFAEARRATLLK